MSYIKKKKKKKPQQKIKSKIQKTGLRKEPREQRREKEGEVNDCKRG